jgi:hypothetical protein
MRPKTGTEYSADFSFEFARRSTTAGQAIYARRKTIVEPVFGQIKQAQGFRQFLLRGVEKARSEWALVCATHNVLKLYRACTA